MTDSTFCQLEKIVEQALKPLWASRARKQMFRMELLAHVMDVFDEELHARGSEQTALDYTLCRFGLAENVGIELQASLGFANRWLYFLFQEKNMKTWLGIVAVAAVFIGLGFIMPAVAKLIETGVAIHLIPYTVGVLMTVGGIAVIGRSIHRMILVR